MARVIGKDIAGVGEPILSPLSHKTTTSHYKGIEGLKSYAPAPAAWRGAPSFRQSRASLGPSACRDATSSFRRLMARPRLGDQRLEVLQLGGTGRNLVSNNEPRRAGDVEQLAKLRIFVQIAVDRGILHVCLQSIDTEADCSSDFEHLGLVDLAARLIKRVMEDNVFAALAASTEPGPRTGNSL